MPRFRNDEIPHIMQRMMEDSGTGFIQPEDVQEAFVLLTAARVGIRDENNPRCLLASGLSSGNGAPEGGPRPVDCGKDASTDVHSITENGVLSNIAEVGKGGREVLQIMPDTHYLANLAKGDAGYPGSRGLWEVDRIPPRLVPISLASVCHSTCRSKCLGMVTRSTKSEQDRLIPVRNVPVA